MNTGGLWRAGIAALAALATVSAQAAESPAGCVSEQELAALTVYVMPRLLSATQGTCGSRLAPDGFLATQATAMSQRYAAKADETWPLAKSGFLKFAGGKDAKDLAGLSDEALRPIFDEVIEQEVAKEIQAKSCRDIERLAKVVSKLDPDTTGELVGVVAALAIGAKKKPRVCEAAES